MLNIEIDKDQKIVLLEPHGALTAADFESATKLIDPYIEQVGAVKGLLIHTQKFPGWDSFAALCSHLKFVGAHHEKIKRVAFASDSTLAGVAEKAAKHFVKAEIKAFPYADLSQAKLWLAGE